MGRTFAYLRVSTAEQTTDNQAQAIQAAGYEVEPRRMIRETISGGVPAMRRPGFAKLVDRLEAGDTLVVLKVDRLGRDCIDIQSTIKALTEQSVKVISLDLGGMDVTSSVGAFSMTMLAAFAQMERDRIRERTYEGLRRAKSQGKRLGRPFAGELSKVKAARDSGLSQSAVAAKLGLSIATVKRYCAELKKAEGCQA